MAAENLNSNSKNGKSAFLKEFSSKIVLIIGDYKYNYIAEIQIEKSVV